MSQGILKEVTKRRFAPLAPLSRGRTGPASQDKRIRRQDFSPVGRGASMRFFVSLAVLATLSVAMLMGCGTGPGVTPTPTPTATPTPTTGATPTPGPTPTPTTPPTATPTPDPVHPTELIDTWDNTDSTNSGLVRLVLGGSPDYAWTATWISGHGSSSGTGWQLVDGGTISTTMLHLNDGLTFDWEILNNGRLKLYQGGSLAAWAELVPV